MGTIGTYHYDDEACAKLIADTVGVIDHLADEVTTQGVGFLDLYLDAVRAEVERVLAVRGGVIPAPDDSRSRTLDGDPPH